MERDRKWEIPPEGARLTLPLYSRASHLVLSLPSLMLGFVVWERIRFSKLGKGKGIWKWHPQWLMILISVVSRRSPFPHHTGHIHAQPCTLPEHKHHCSPHISSHLERGNKKCTQQYLCMCKSKYTHTIHPSRRMQRGTQFICREICIF